MLPVKWMPPEAFMEGVFTCKTDTWYEYDVHSSKYPQGGFQWLLFFQPHLRPLIKEFQRYLGLSKMLNIRF